MKRIRLHPAARRELREAESYYNGKQPGLGSRWTKAVNVTGQRIRTYPGAGRIAAGRVRERSVTGFPYGLVYLDKPAEIFVLAVAHRRRRPGYWLDRLPPEE